MACGKVRVQVGIDSPVIAGHDARLSFHEDMRVELSFLGCYRDANCAGCGVSTPDGASEQAMHTAIGGQCGPTSSQASTSLTVSSSNMLADGREQQLFFL